MRTRKLEILIALALLATLFAGMASAAPIIRLDATVKPSAAGTLTSFSLTFEDLDGDSDFSINELRTFSGITRTSLSSIFYESLIVVPIITDIADGTDDFFWTFRTTNPATLAPFGIARLDTSEGISDFTYVLTSVPTTVPEPTTLSLVALSLAGVGWKVRRQRA